MAKTGFSRWLPLGGLAERINFCLDLILDGKAYVFDEGNRHLFGKGISFLDAVIEGMELIKNDRILGAPMESLDKFSMASEIFERMDETERNFAEVVKVSRDSLAAFREGKGPEEIKEGLGMARKFFGTSWAVSLEHQAD